MLLVSSVLLVIGLTGAGMFSVAIGIVHVAIPRIVRYRLAIGADGGGLAGLGPIGVGPLSYQLQRSDLVGIAWVMSNAASYVLVTIGVVDLAWAAGWRGIPLGVGATWIAGWWAIRAVSQLAIGRRRGDILAVAWFAALAAAHVGVALDGASLG